MAAYTSGSTTTNATPAPVVVTASVAPAAPGTPAPIVVQVTPAPAAKV
jgi:hypothetical protein